jgi:dephospho-CoA kinase
MRLIGLTGGIATGKSTVAQMLRERGATVIDADELARQAVRPGTAALAEIAARFGDHVIDANGELDRAAMADIVFADAAARRDLERITHPRVMELMQQQIADAFARDATIVVVDVPLLFETGRDDMFEGVLLVHTQPGVQVRRLRDRDGLSEAAALQRLDAQLPIDQKRSRATWVIENADNLADTERQVAAWWDEVVGNSR